MDEARKVRRMNRRTGSSRQAGSAKRGLGVRRQIEGIPADISCRVVVWRLNRSSWASFLNTFGLAARPWSAMKVEEAC